MVPFLWYITLCPKNNIHMFQKLNSSLVIMAKFWVINIEKSNILFLFLLFLSSMFSGNQDLRAHEAPLKTWHPSVIETLPNDYPELKMEFTKLESQMFDKPMRRAHEPLTPVIADANDRW